MASSDNLSTSDLVQTDLIRTYTRSAIAGISKLRFRGTNQSIQWENGTNLNFYAGDADAVGAIPSVSIKGSGANVGIITFRNGGAKINTLGDDLILTGQSNGTIPTSIELGINIVFNVTSPAWATWFKSNKVNFKSNDSSTFYGSMDTGVFVWSTQTTAPSPIANEKFSIQEDTLIKGSNNSASTSGFKVTDVNNLSLLDVRNNGQTCWGGAKVVNVAHIMYNPSNQASSLLRLIDNNGTTGINLGTAGRITTANSSQGVIFLTFAQGGVPHIQLYHSSRGLIVDLQSGASHIDATSLVVGGQTGITGAKFTIQNASANTYQQLFFANVRTTTNGFINSSGSFNADQKGLEGFDTDKNKKFFWNGTAWEKIKGNIESVSVASATTITPNIDSSEMEIVSALASALTIAVPTGVASSFYEGKELTFRIKDNGNAYGLTWNAIFVDYTGALPTTTVAGKTVYIGCKYNVVDTKWDVVAVQVQP